MIVRSKGRHGWLTRHQVMANTTSPSSPPYVKFNNSHARFCCCGQILTSYLVVCTAVRFGDLDQGWWVYLHAVSQVVLQFLHLNLSFRGNLFPSARFLFLPFFFASVTSFSLKWSSIKVLPYGSDSEMVLFWILTSTIAGMLGYIPYSSFALTTMVVVKSFILHGNYWGITRPIFKDNNRLVIHFVNHHIVRKHFQRRMRCNSITIVVVP